MSASDRTRRHPEAIALLRAANSNDAGDERSVSIAVAAQVLGCNQSTVRELVRRGLLAAFRIGKTANPTGVRIRLWSVQEWQEAHAIAPAGDAASIAKVARRCKRQHNRLDEKAEAKLKALGA